MFIESILQDVLVVLAIGLLKRLARVPFFYFENGIATCCALGFNGNTPQPFCHSKSWLFCRHEPPRPKQLAISSQAKTKSRQPAANR